MGSVPSRAKHLETGISISILAILVITGVGILVKQSKYDMDSFGMGIIETQSAPEKPQDKQNDVFFSGFLPDGFIPPSKPEIYNSENLYEKIDGKAPQYTQSGFEKLMTQRFVNKADDSLAMEVFVYDMANGRNAFSVYTGQQRPDTETLADLGFAYRAGNAVYLAHGKYYVEIIGFSESPELIKAITQTAGNFVKNITVDNANQIDELRLFGKENLVSGSIKFYLSSAFGFDKLTNIFSAVYNIDGNKVTVFLSNRKDAKEAQEMAKSYYSFLIENGGTPKKAASASLDSKVVNFYDTTEIVLSTGPFVAGIHEAENQPAAEKLILSLIEKLNKEVKK